MHSNSHLGISLAAMTHVAATLPNLDHSCDTHYPWNSADDVIVPGPLELRDGAVQVPTGPGLGVELDHDASRVRAATSTLVIRRPWTTHQRITTVRLPCRRTAGR